MIAQRPSIVGNPWEEFPFVKFSVGSVEEKNSISQSKNPMFWVIWTFFGLGFGFLWIPAQDFEDYKFTI